jgi:hypothetical protein
MTTQRSETRPLRLEQMQSMLQKQEDILQLKKYEQLSGAQQFRNFAELKCFFQ